MEFILVAIAKNEAPFIKEWVAYHRWVCGFDTVLIYENDSSDESKDVLSELSKIGLCNWIEWPRSEHNPPQTTAYADALNRFRNVDGWMCFLDIDEFLVLKKHKSIKDFLSKIPKNVGSVSFNWKIFYSKDEFCSKDFVTKRMEFVLEDNGHVKTIARIKAIKVPCVHTCRLAPGFRYLNSCGFDYSINLNELSDIKMSLDASMCVRRSHINYENAQINHYQIKSKNYCINKDNRGCACAGSFMNPNSTIAYENCLKIVDQKSNYDIKNIISKIKPNFYEELNST